MTLKILLVEDNPDDVHLTKFALKKEGIENDMYVARDGEEAEIYLQRIGVDNEAHTPDLIILDLNLPKKNGFSVLSVIKSHPDLKAVPVIILTTSKSKIDIVKSYSNHANSYIQKPSELSEFFEVIRSIKSYWINTVLLPNLKAS